MADGTAVHPLVTPDDHSPLLIIAIYFLMVTFVLAVLIRFGIRLSIARSLAVDDWVSFGSMISGILQSVAVTIAVHNGLGKTERLLDQSQVVNIAKALYTSDYFYVISLGLSKIAILLLLRRLMANRIHKQMAIYTAYYVVVWTVATVLAVALRCAPHLPWSGPSPSISPSSCMNVHTFWVADAPFDFVSEIMIIGLPIAMMIPVHVSMAKKAVIVVAFLFRAMVIGATIVRLFYILPALPSENFTFRDINSIYLTQTTLCVAITTSCIPCLKPFLDAFDSGQMAVHFKHGVPGSHSNSRSYPMRDLAYGNSLAYGKSSAIRSHIDTRAAGDEEDAIEVAKYHGQGQVRGKNSQQKIYSGHDRRGASGEDSHSIVSEAKSDQMIIKKNVAWTVQYEDMDHTHTGVRTTQSRLDDDSGDDDGAGAHDRKGRGDPVGYAV